MRAVTTLHSCGTQTDGTEVPLVFLLLQPAMEGTTALKEQRPKPWALI